MSRIVNPDEAVVARYGPVPVGDVVLEVTVAGEVIARMDIYWHTIKVGRRKPIPVAFFDHLWVDPTYEDMGFGPGLFAAGMLVAAREVEWGALYSPRPGFFGKFGYVTPDDATDHLLVAPLTGQPQTWPPGRIVAAAPLVDD
jgi:predicted N-acetyltransferase YhbS